MFRLTKSAGRFVTALQIALVSNDALTSVPTAITSMVLTPLMEALLLVAVLASVGVPDIRDAAYASIVLSFGRAVLGGTVGEVSHDRQIGVAQEIVGYRLWNPAYWFGKLVPLLLLGIVPAVLSALAVFWAFGGDDVEALIRVLWGIPLAALVGALVGVTAAVASFALSDPYLISNILGSVLIITAGVVLPIGYYPAWLAAISRLLPFTAAVELVRGTGPAVLLLVRELAVSAVWLAIGLLIARRVMALIRSGRRSSEMW